MRGAKALLNQTGPNTRRFRRSARTKQVGQESHPIAIQSLPAMRSHPPEPTLASRVHRPPCSPCTLQCILLGLSMRAREAEYHTRSYRRSPDSPKTAPESVHNSAEPERTQSRIRRGMFLPKPSLTCQAASTDPRKDISRFSRVPDTSRLQANPPAKELATEHCFMPTAASSGRSPTISLPDPMHHRLHPAQVFWQILTDSSAATFRRLTINQDTACRK